MLLSCYFLFTIYLFLGKGWTISSILNFYACCSLLLPPSVPRLGLSPPPFCCLGWLCLCPFGLGPFCLGAFGFPPFCCLGWLCLWPFPFELALALAVWAGFGFGAVPWGLSVFGFGLCLLCWPWCWLWCLLFGLALPLTFAVWAWAFGVGVLILSFCIIILLSLSFKVFPCFLHLLVPFFKRVLFIIIVILGYH